MSPQGNSTTTGVLTPGPSQKTDYCPKCGKTTIFDITGVTRYSDRREVSLHCTECPYKTTDTQYFTTVSGFRPEQSVSIFDITAKK